MKDKLTENSGKSKKRKLTKRGLLYLANGIAFAVVFIFSFYFIAMSHEFMRFTLIFLLIQCAFTFLSLIVYYLSIMADALNKKYQNIEKNDKSTE